MSRIRSTSIQYGNSYIIGGHETNPELVAQEQLSSLTEEKKHLEEDIDNLLTELNILREEKGQILENAKEQAQQIIEKANQNAEQIMSTATQEAEVLKQQAHEQALAEGKEQGYQEGFVQCQNDLKDESDNKLLALTSLVDASFEIKREIVLSAEHDILDMVVMIAQKLMQVELSQNKEVIANIVKTAITSLKDKEEVKILINPSVAEVVYSISEDLKDNIKGLEQIKIVEDRTISPDGVIVESVDSRVDARLSTQLAEIVKNLETQREKNLVEAQIPEEVEEKIVKKQTRKPTKKKATEEADKKPASKKKAEPSSESEQEKDD